MELFTVEQYQRKKNRLKTLPSCGACGLHKTCFSPKMKPSGKGKKGILFIAEAPGEIEDKRGTQLVGKVGQLHRRTCKRLGVDIDRDAIKINAINCRPPDNETPNDKQIEACRPNVFKEIEKFKPKLIVLLGSIAVKSLLGHRYLHDDSIGGITKWRGFCIPDRELNCWVCPTFHPSYVSRMEGNGAVELTYKQDLKRAFKQLKEPFPKFEDEQSLVNPILDENEAVKFLKSFIKQKNKYVCFDYECTGLKPHLKKHEIVSCSFSTSDKSADAFLVTHKTAPLLRKILRSTSWKIAANMKFEEMWSRVKLKTRVRNWLIDTMIAQHWIDHRKGITGLKFQSYVRYGLIDYDSHIKPLLQGDDPDNANSFNRIHKIPLEDLLTYNGVDTILEYRAAVDMAREMGFSFKDLIRRHNAFRA